MARLLAVPSLQTGQLNCSRDDTVAALWLGMLFSMILHKFRCLFKLDILKDGVITGIYLQAGKLTIWLKSS